MVRVFKEATCTLSEEYVSSFITGNLTVALFRIGKDAGVELEFNQPNNSFTLTGDWINMVKAHTILEEHFMKELNSEHFQSKYLSNTIELSTNHDGVVTPCDKSHELSSPPVLQNGLEMDQALTRKPSLELNNVVENKPIGYNNGTDDEGSNHNNSKTTDSACITIVNEVTNDELKQEIMDVIEVRTDAVNVGFDQDQPCVSIEDTVMNGNTNHDKESPGVNLSEFGLPSSTVINVVDTETDTKIPVEIMDEANPAKQQETSELSDNVYGDNMIDNLIMHCEDAETEAAGELITNNSNNESVIDDNPGNDLIFECDKCNYVAKKKSYVRVHKLRMHSKRKRFSCHLCEKAFALNSDLLDHARDRHSTLSTFCKICDKTFTSLRSFKGHMAIHENKVSFNCETCSKTFTSKHLLQRHMKFDHLGLNRRPFTCQTCGRGFAYEESLSMHENRHKGLKPYVCDICGRAFSYKTCMIEHKYIHDENRKFRCDLCPQRYKVEKSLLNHIAKKHNHAGSVCAICGKVFKKVSYMQMHVRHSHGEIKAFKCLHCPESFYSITLRTQHMIKHHKLPKYK